MMSQMRSEVETTRERHWQFRETKAFREALAHHNIRAETGVQIREELIKVLQDGYTGVYRELAKKLVWLMVKAGIDTEHYGIPISEEEIIPLIDELEKESKL